MSIDRDRLLTAVRELDLPAGEYVVFGSGPLVVRGLREGGDIDLVVTPALYEWLSAGEWTARMRDDGGETLSRGDFDVMRLLEFPGYVRDVRDLIAMAEWIDGVPFVPLPELRTFKAALGRPKDQVDLDLIDEALTGDDVGLPTAGEIAHAEAVLAAEHELREEAAWEGNGWTFLAGTFTRPATTFHLARTTSCWGVACLALLVGSAAWQASRWLLGAEPTRLLWTPPLAAVAALFAVVVARCALEVASTGRSRRSRSAAYSQTGVLVGLGLLLCSLAAMVVHQVTVLTIVLTVVAVTFTVMTGLLYSRSYQVSYPRGLLGTVLGYVAALALAVVPGLAFAACYPG